MARKRAVKKIIKKEKIKIERLKPLVSGEELYFKDLIDSSGRYVEALKKRDGYKNGIKVLQLNRTKIQKGDIKPPFTLTLIPNVLSHTISDKKEILKLFDEQIKSYQTNLKSMTGQIEHRYEDYVESAQRNRDFWLRRFGSIKSTTVTPNRAVTKDEEVLFEAEFEKLMQDPKKQEEFIKASKEAVKRNTGRKIKAKK